MRWNYFFFVCYYILSDNKIKNSLEIYVIFVLHILNTFSRRCFGLEMSLMCNSSCYWFSFCKQKYSATWLANLVLEILFAFQNYCSIIPLIEQILNLFEYPMEFTYSTHLISMKHIITDFSAQKSSIKN